MQKKISEMLKKLRTENGLTQEALATYLGLERQTVSAYEKGIREPSIDTLVKLADFYKVSLDYIICGEKTGQKCSKKNNILSAFKGKIEKTADDKIMSYKEIRSKFIINEPQNTYGPIIGKDEKTGYPISINPDYKTDIARFSEITAVFGSAGSGKTQAYTLNKIAQTIKAGESAIITDVSGELFRVTSNCFRDSGYNVKVFNLADKEHSDSWNILSEIEKNPFKIVERVNILSDVIIKSPSLMDEKETLFDTYSCQNLFMALCLLTVLDDYRDEYQKNMGFVFELLSLNDDKKLNIMFSKLKMGHPAKSFWNTYLAFGDEIRATTRMFLKRKLKAFESITFRDITAHNEIDTEAPAKEKCAYFVITSPYETTFDFMSSAFITFCVSNIHEYAYCNGKCDVPVNFILDEFCNLDAMSGFASKIAVLKGRNIRISIILQHLSQIKNKYPDSWNEIIACCGTIINMGVIDNDTIRFFVNDVDAGVSEEKIRNMKNENSIIYIRREKPMIVEKYFCNENDVFLENWSDIKMYAPKWKIIKEAKEFADKNESDDLLYSYNTNDNDFDF